MMPGPWSESPPVAGIPASSGAGDPNQSAYLKFMQALQQLQQQRDRGAGIASGARAGIPLGVPLPQGVPSGGGGQGQAQQPQVQGPVPSATGGGTAFPGAQVRQAQQAQQIPYATTGKGAWAANAVYGLSNMLSQKRQEDQQKEYTQAENLWTQVLQAQQNIQNAANQGQDDPEDKARIKAILDDDKNRKIIQDAMPGVLMTQPGDPQQQETDPKKQAQQAGARGALQKVGRAIGGAFDPRTQAQRMPGGTTTPINTPGGAQWKFPQPTPQQQAAALTPEEAAKQARIKAGLELNAQQAAQNRINIMKEQDIHKRVEEYDKYLNIYKQKEEDDYKAKMAAVAVRKAAAEAKQDPAAVQSYHDLIAKRQMGIKDVPAAQRGAVAKSFEGQDMPTPFNAKDAEEWKNDNLAMTWIQRTKKDVAELQRLKPEIFDDPGPGLVKTMFKKGSDLADTTAQYYQYKYGMEPGGANPELAKAWSNYLEDLGFLQIQGLEVFSNITRNWRTQQRAIIHLPDPGDTPRLIARDKLPWLTNLTDDRLKQLDSTNKRYVSPSAETKRQQDAATSGPTSGPQSLSDFMGQFGDTTIPYVPTEPQE